MSNNAIEDLYLVQDGVDDVVANDHNTLVEAAQFLNSTFGGSYNFGNGIEGNLKLGAITNPTASNVATLASAGVTGYVTGTFYYKYSVYNLSGETLPTNASATVTVAAGQVDVTIPAQGSNTNVTGYYIYRSPDDITYYRVGFLAVEDATGANVFRDNNPVTSGTAPSGSNTTGNTATIGGIWRCKTLTLNGSQTITLDNTNPLGLVIIAQDTIDLKTSSTITGDAKMPNLLATVGVPASSNTTFYQATFGQGVGATTLGSSYGHGTATQGQAGYSVANSSIVKLGGSNPSWFGAQGGAATAELAGGSVVLIAKNRINLNGSISVNGSIATAGTANSGSTAGGLIYAAATIIDRTSGTLSANGGNGIQGTGTVPSAAGAGGGIVALFSNVLIGSATITTSGGSSSSGNGSGSGNARRGSGAFGGDAGSTGSGTSGGGAGSSGFTVTDTLRNVSIIQF